MRLLPTRALGRSCAAPAVLPLPPLDPDAYLTLDGTFHAPALTTTPRREDPAAAALYDNAAQVIWQQDGAYLNLEQVTYQDQPAPALSAADEPRGLTASVKDGRGSRTDGWVRYRGRGRGAGDASG